LQVIAPWCWQPLSKPSSTSYKAASEGSLVLTISHFSADSGKRKSLPLLGALKGSSFSPFVPNKGISFTVMLGFGVVRYLTQSGFIA
jgi:hypothetical protein